MQFGRYMKILEDYGFKPVSNNGQWDELRFADDGKNVIIINPACKVKFYLVPGYVMDHTLVNTILDAMEAFYR